MRCVREREIERVRERGGEREREREREGGGSIGDSCDVMVTAALSK